MKKLLPLIIIIAIAGYLWFQNKTAMEVGQPEKSLLQKIINAIPSQTLREKIPGSAEARAAEEAAQIRYRFTQTWHGIMGELLKPIAHKQKPVWAKDLATSINNMNAELARLSDASKAEQRLGYLGQKFNASLLYVNTTRQKLQKELRSSLNNKARRLKGSKVSPEDQAKLYLQSADRRWKELLTVNQAQLKSQLHILKKAEAEANARPHNPLNVSYPSSAARTCSSSSAD